MTAGNGNCNGFSVSQVLKVAGWLCFAVASAVGVMLWFNASFTSLRMSLGEHEAQLRCVEVKITNIEKESTLLRVEQKEQGKKIDEVLSRLPK